MSNVIKEIFIILLLCMVVIFTIGLLLYDCIPLKSENIESIEYVADKQVMNVIDEINSKDNLTSESTNEVSLLKSYSVGKDDLNEFASENSYETGKSDPFAEYAMPILEETVTNSAKESATGKYTENRNSR